MRLGIAFLHVDKRNEEWVWRGKMAAFRNCFANEPKKKLETE